MKLHIHSPACKLENSHDNINCLPTITLPQRISSRCCPEEAEQIYLNASINTWEKETFIKNMATVMNLLPKGGILTVKDFDLLLLSNSIMREPQSRNNCVSIMTKCKWIYDMQSIKDFLLQNSFTITNSYYVLEDFTFIVIGVKN